MGRGCSDRRPSNIRIRLFYLNNHSWNPNKERFLFWSSRNFSIKLPSNGLEKNIFVKTISQCTPHPLHPLKKSLVHIKFTQFWLVSPGWLELAESPFLQLHRSFFVDSGETSTVGGSVKDVLSCPHSYTTLTGPQPSPLSVDFLSALLATKHKDVSIKCGSGLSISFLTLLSYSSFSGESWQPPRCNGAAL